MPGLWPISLVMFAGLYTWLGMFILTRDRQNSRSWFVMLAFIALAVWYFSTAMVHVTQGNSFGRTLWFRISLAAIVTAYTLWFQATVLLSLALFRPNHPRRWLKDYERTTQSSELMIYIASIHTMLKRLAPAS